MRKDKITVSASLEFPRWASELIHLIYSISRVPENLTYDTGSGSSPVYLSMRGTISCRIPVRPAYLMHDLSVGNHIFRLK